MEDRTLLSTFLVSTTADSGAGSLRQAILDSNTATGGTSTIDFAIPGQGVQTIAPLSPLPTITSAVLIDGFTQPGYSGTPLIEVSGSQAGEADGLTITGSDVTVRGLDIGNFLFGAGIVVDGSNASGDVIVDDVIGTDTSGTMPLPNGPGIQISGGAHDNTVGGTDPALGNLIADNLGQGVVITDDGSIDNRLSGNRIFNNGQTGLTFDGQGAHVVIPDDPGLEFSAAQSFTLTAWVDIPSLPNQWSGIVTKSRDQYPWYGLWISDTNQWVFGGGANIYGPTVTPGRHYLALVQDGAAGTRTLYVDGVAVASGAAQDGNGTGALWIGSSNSAYENFDGEIGPVAIWSIALSADQVSSGMTATLTGYEPGLQAAYNFDEGSGTVVHDLTSNHQDGTLESLNGSSLPMWTSSEGAIDLGGDGTTFNSPAPRMGPNNLQNFPIIVTTTDGQLEGWLGGSTPNTLFHIDVFASTAYGSGGSGQAEDYLGSLDVTTDSRGQVVFDVPFTAPSALPIVTATATDPEGNTSEVSALRRAALQAPLQDVQDVSGQPISFSPQSGDAIALEDADAGSLDPAWDLTLSVSAGTLSLSSLTGLVGSGDGTGALHYEGSLSALNAALEGLNFTPSPGFQVASLIVSAQSYSASPVQGRVLIVDPDGGLVVTTTADSGPGSLRQAILDSNSANSGQDTIRFALPGLGVQTIFPLSPLPAITTAVVIDGWSQPGFAGTPLIELSGSQQGGGDGLTITGAGVTVRGLDIDSFYQGAGIHITGTAATNNWVYGIFAGTDPTGAFSEPNYAGVAIDGGAGNNLIGTNGDGVDDAAERNVLSGNLFAGVSISGQGTDANVVAGNFLGTDISGSVPLNNGTQPLVDSQGYYFGGGVAISGGASNNRIGTDGASVDDVGQRNVIAGSNNDAIDIWGTGTDGNVAAGNFIGTDGTGTRSLGVAGDGVFLAEGASFNWIGVNPTGGTAIGDEGNVISGNGSDGVQIISSGTDDNVIAGNRIGTDVTGTVAVGNGGQGIEVDSGSVDNTIGGTVSGSGNVISGNQASGVWINGNGAIDNLIEGNRIGTDANGTAALGNSFWGVVIQEAADNTVGGPTAAARNVISGNLQGGVAIRGIDAVGDVVQGNLIGTDFTGTQALGNSYSGVYVGDWGISGDAASDATIGGTTSGAGNVISANGNWGIWITGNGAAGNVVQGNLIGTDITGTIALGNAESGVQIDNGASFNTIGGTIPAAGNVISANGGYGVRVTGTGTEYNLVQGNTIGTDFAGTVALGNTQGGGQVDNGAANNTMGGLTTAAGVFHGFDFTSAASSINLTLSGDLSGPPPQQTSGGPTAVFHFDVEADGDLLAIVHATGFTTRLMMLNSQAQVLVESDGLSPTDPDSVIDQFVSAGNYSLVIESTLGAGTYVLTTMLTPASNPFQAIPVGVNPSAIVTGDFNGDGHLDLAVANRTDGDVSVLLGNGDGTFQPAVDYPVGSDPDAIVAGDFNGDGRTDLAVVNEYDNDVSVLLGNGDGTFQPQVTYAVGSGPTAIVTGNFTGDGHLDLAVVNSDSYPSGHGTVSVLLGNGDGTFQPQVTYEVGAVPSSIVAGDFNGDGRTDLAVANSQDGSVSVLLGNGNGTFGPQITYAAGPDPESIVAGSFTGDGRTDLAVANGYNSTVSVLLGNGNGTFQPRVTYAVAFGAGPIVAADFNGDGRTDLAFLAEGTASVLLGNGDGTFQPAAYVAMPVGATAIAVGDFNNAGQVDVAIATDSNNYSPGTVSVLFNKGDGTFFQGGLTNPVGVGPDEIVAGDFNGDGRTDLAVADESSNVVSILLGNGDGTFQPALQYAVGYLPSAIVAGDFNGDGRLDLAVIDSDGVQILLGNGDGTFHPATTVAAGVGGDLAVGDWNGDGRLDLAVSDSAGVQILLGNGDGTFQRVRTVAAGIEGALVAGDWNGDGDTDLAVVDALNYGSPGTISVLLSNGNGTFQAPQHYAVASYPWSIVAGDFTGNGRIDLAVASTSSGPGITKSVGEVSVLLGNGDGTFQPEVTYAAGGLDDGTIDIVAGDFNGDGKLDLAVENPIAGTATLLLGNGNGTFQPQLSTAAGSAPGPIVAGDWNGDGKFDLATVNLNSDDVSVLLATGDGALVDPGQFVTTPHATPLVADVNGDGTDDVLVVDSAGNILYRQGVPGRPGVFEPPVTVNPPLADGTNPYTSRDIAWVPSTRQGPLVASVDARDANISLYAYRDGSFVRIGSVATGELPAQVIAADLNGTGSDDLVVRNAGDGTLSIYYNAGDKTVSGLAFSGPKNTGNQLFGFRITLSAGIGVSDVQAVDTTGDGRLDLVVTNELTGQVSILLNLGGGKFAAPVPYRAGTGFSEIDPGDTPEVTSREATAGAAAGPLAPGGPIGLVTINSGSDTIDVVAGLGGGRFANPVTLATQVPAQVVRMADFTGNGIDDLAVLTAVGVTIYMGDGHGGFASPVTYAVPSESSGLTVADVNHDGKLDLLVGDAYGDVLVLLGNGNGTFAPYHDANQSVELAVADLSGNGTEDIIYADQSLDRVVVDYGAGNSTVLASQSTGLLNPGAVTLADLNGDGIPDLIVANSGSNNVLIYPGLGNGQFGPAVNDGNGYFVGTNPVGITVANLTGALPDLVVADEGSNDVFILLNQGNFSFTSGPRFSSGGIGPVSTVVGDFTAGSTKPDILATNSDSNNVTLLQGVGGAFFKPPIATPFSVGTGPQQSIVGNFDGNLDLLTVNAGSNDLTLISNFESPDPSTTTISSGGLDPDAAFAFESSSGFDDLVIGNAGDGVLALLEGGQAGLTLMSTQVEPDLPSPTSLAFSALTGGQIQFYAATAGREAADLVSLNLAADTSFQVALPGPSNPIAQLVPSEGSSLPLVAVVLTLTIEVSANELSLPSDAAENGGTGAFLAGSGITVGQSLSSAGQGGGSGAPMIADELAAGGAGAGAAQAQALPWERFVLGLDRVFERFLRENPNGLSGALDRSDRPGSTATPSSPAPGNPPGSQSTPAPPPQSGDHDGAQGSNAAETSKAVDSIIESFWKDDGSSGQSQQSTEGGLPPDARIGGGPHLRVVTSWETVPRAHDSPSESSGVGNRRVWMTLPVRQPGIDEPSLAAPLAFVVLANEWARWRLTSQLRRSHMRKETELANT